MHESERISTRLRELGALVPEGDFQLQGSGSGPLKGLSFVVKDLFDVAGYRTSAGNPDWLAEQAPASVTAPLVSHLLDSGADLFGKTITDDFACGMFGENIHYGTPLNSRSPERVPGGSSSGSVAAVAGGAVDFSIGTDTGGSVRVPASFCGIYGMRPSHGYVNMNRCFPQCDYFDTAGWFTRSVDLLQVVGDVILSPGDPFSELDELLVAEDVLDWVEPKVAEAFTELFRWLEVSGRGKFFNRNGEHYLNTYWPLMSRQLWNTHREWLEAKERTLAPGLADRLREAGKVDALAFQKATEDRADIAAHFNDALGSHGAFLLPTTPDLAPLKGGELGDLNRFRSRCVSMVGGASLAGLPQISIPAIEIQGATVGLSLLGPRGSDRALLRLAKSIDQRLVPWRQRYGPGG
ncbi:amidase [Pelagicoccus albus]|uniref:Amidase n=1 Tax=Pelagicoccus albus TaxID=415222 RepID=A0A7X1B988_9BACT|nr:amidase [Pelagicoccus albus]MBC2607906.1 amidase [Pelagicoccus albus]